MTFSECNFLTKWNKQPNGNYSAVDYADDNTRQCAPPNEQALEKLLNSPKSSVSSIWKEYPKRKCQRNAELVCEAQ